MFNKEKRNITIHRTRVSEYVGPPVCAKCPQKMPGQAHIF